MPLQLGSYYRQAYLAHLVWPSLGLLRVNYVLSRCIRPLVLYDAQTEAFGWL